MDPLTAFGVAGAAYLGYRKVREVAPAPVIADNAKVKDLTLQLTQPQQGLLAGQFITSLQLDTLAQVDHSSDYVHGLIKNEKIGFDLVSWVVSAVTAVAIPFVFLGILIDELSRGREWYRTQLTQMGADVRDRMKVVLATAPLSDAQKTDVAKLFGFCVARSYNDAARALSKAYPGGSVNYFAERGWMIEDDYVMSAMMRTPGMRSVAPYEQGGGTIEYKLCDARTVDEVRNALAGVWTPELEGVANFVGRALACTRVGHAMNDDMKMRNWLNTVGIPPAVFVGCGAIGLDSEQLPNASPKYTTAPGGDAAFGGIRFGSSLDDAENGILTDGTGRTSLRWYYRASWEQSRCIVKEK